MEKIIFICNRYGVTMDELFKEEVPTPGEPPVEAPLLSARTLGSELSNLYANLSPYNKSIGIMLLTVIAMIGPAYVYCMRSLKGGADEMMTIIWIAAIIIFGIAEAATAVLVSIWFVVGAVAALVATELGAAELVAFPSARCVDGKTWTARSEDGNIIPKGKMARIVRMEGVKLYVRESKEPSERRE